MGYISKHSPSPFGFLSRPNALEQLLADAAASFESLGAQSAGFGFGQCPPVPNPLYLSLLHAGDFCSVPHAPGSNMDLNAGSADQSSGSSAGGDGKAPRAVDARRKFKCPRCTSTFSRKDNLKTHQRLHSGEMPFECRFCSRKFMWQSSARTHELTHQRPGRSRRAHVTAAAPAAPSAPPVASGSAAAFAFSASNPAASAGGQPVCTESAPAYIDSALSQTAGAGAMAAPTNPSLGPVAVRREYTSLTHQPLESPVIQAEHAETPPNTPSTAVGFGCGRASPCPIPVPESSHQQVSLASSSIGPTPSSSVVSAAFSSLPVGPSRADNSIDDSGMAASLDVPASIAHYTYHTNRSTGRRTAVPQLHFPPRIPVESSANAASGALLSFDELMDGDDTGRELGGLAPVTPQVIAESPMFGGNRLSQHDLERYMENVSDQVDDPVDQYRS